RNADSHVRRLEGCARDEVVDQYPGGFEGRAAEIEAGASRPATEIIADVHATIDAFDAACAAMPADAWDRWSRGVGGTMRTAAELVGRRWMESEVHHVDLGLAYTVDDWPDDFVERFLLQALERLPQRLPPGASLPNLDEVPRRELLGWTYDRV